MMIGPKDKPGQYALKNAAGDVVEIFTNRAKLMKAFVAAGAFKAGFSMEQVG